MNTDHKIRIYCVFSGLGKTYFCQHNPGWAEIEEESYTRLRLHPIAPILAMKCYHKYGYKLLTNASPYILNELLKERNIFDITLIIPSKEMKEEILQRVRKRGDPEWADMLTNIYDRLYSFVCLISNVKVIYAQPGEYLTDIMKRESLY